MLVLYKRVTKTYNFLMSTIVTLIVSWYQKPIELYFYKVKTSMRYRRQSIVLAHAKNLPGIKAIPKAKIVYAGLKEKHYKCWKLQKVAQWKQQGHTST